MNATEPFPLDWNEWRAQWDAWETANLARFPGNRTPFKGKNFLADEVLGVYRAPRGTVELSEVTFPNFHDRDPRTGILIREEYRYVRLTFANGETDLVRTFEQLAEALGFVNPARVNVGPGPHYVTGLQDS